MASNYLVQEDTILLESDIIFDSSLIWKLVKTPAKDVAIVDKYQNWMDGTMVTLGEDGFVSRFIDKSEFDYKDTKNYYKTVNIYKFSKSFLSHYFLPLLSVYIKTKGKNEYYEQVLRVLLYLCDSKIKGLTLSGEKWYEIDDEQDLDIASSLFAPAECRYQTISSRYGGFWRYPHMLDYCYLVNPYFPPTRMVEEMKSVFADLLREYPSGMKVNSSLAARYFGVKQENIVVGNGAAELIKTLIENHTESLGYVLPTFEEYPNRLPMNLRYGFMPKKEGFRYSVEDLILYFSDKPIKSLLLINPDNPSGNFLRKEEVVRLVTWTKERNMKIIIDESFVDFATDSFTLIDDSFLAENPHLFIVKSISKCYGVPGLRLGVLASGNSELIAKIKREVSIWNINSFGEFYMQIFEKYKKDYSKACQKFQEERSRFFEEISSIEYLQVFPSEANFFLCKIKNRFSSTELASKLIEKNILIKECGHKEGMSHGEYLRLAIRGKEENMFLTEMLKSF